MDVFITKIGITFQLKALGFLKDFSFLGGSQALTLCPSDKKNV